MKNDPKRSKHRLERYEQPKRIIFAEDLPRNTMGKVQKNVLRQQHADLYAGVKQCSINRASIVKQRPKPRNATALRGKICLTARTSKAVQVVL
ncbi:hypothetical protein [Mesorhizobium erdmanii]|uniref:hypothetical protein n=1 Tax=Mesorhizobium erdmanii TaxID=1777866 RepID=UPI000407EC95|nr:hypothetical protein [Mesorhizobium erdmanii]